MPNICRNWARFSHKDPKKFQELCNAITKSELCSYIMPEPDYKKTVVMPTYPHISGNEPVDPSSAWWDWRVQNWGTKLELNLRDGFSDICPNTNTASINFESAWSPPIGIYNKAVELGFEVEAEYDEPGMDFCGRYINGKDECIRTSDSFREGTMPKWALDDYGDRTWEGMVDCGEIDNEGNLFDYETKLMLKKHGEWGHVEFNKRMLELGS